MVAIGAPQAPQTFAPSTLALKLGDESAASRVGTFAPGEFRTYFSLQGNSFWGLKRTTRLSPKTQSMWRGLVALMGLFAGLCTIFAFFVTVAEAWQERAQAQWPEATARIERCGLHPTSTGRRDRYYIDCRLGYVVSIGRSAPSGSFAQRSDSALDLAKKRNILAAS